MMHNHADIILVILYPNHWHGYRSQKGNVNKHSVVAMEKPHSNPFILGMVLTRLSVFVLRKSDLCTHDCAQKLVESETREAAENL